MNEILKSMSEPVHALPLDLFRVLAGLLAFEYFRRAYASTPEFTSPEGLIDHTLCQRLFPPTRMGLFQSGMPARAFRTVFLVGCAASLSLAAGYHPRPAAAVLFGIAISTYRWNVLIAYVDDAIMHLVLFWLIVLPVGQTLHVAAWISSDPAAALAEWPRITVGGLSSRLFLANLALIYLTSGLYKFTSPLWRSGLALPVVLRLPFSRFPKEWTMRYLPALRTGSYAVLIAEPLFALVFVLPDDSVAKWSIVVIVVAFHVGIALTLQIPFANLAMLGALPIAFGPEIMSALGQPSPAATGTTRFGMADAAAVLLVAALALMILWEVVCRGRFTNVPLWRDRLRANPVCAVLWVFGICQSYRLFDWIDQRNYHVTYEVFLSPSPGPATCSTVPVESLFPRTLRHVLLQSYMFGNIWMQMDRKRRGRIAKSILSGYANRFARNTSGAGRVEAFSIVQRITPDNLDLRRGRKQLLVRFDFSDGVATIEYAREAG